MFSKVAILSTVSLALLAAAAPHSNGPQCNTGEIQCCNSVHKANSEQAAILHSILGVATQGGTLMAGENCSPISAIGVGSGASCTQQPVCCSNNEMNGLIVVGCTPINISL